MESLDEIKVIKNDPKQEVLKEDFIYTKKDLEFYGLGSWRERNKWIKDSLKQGNMSTSAAIGHTVEQVLIAPIPGVLVWLLHMRSKSNVDKYAEKLTAEYDLLQKNIEEKAVAYAEATGPDQDERLLELEKAELELSEFLKNKGTYHINENRNSY